jgi:probable rRNA maturation factor
MILNRQRAVRLDRLSLKEFVRRVRDELSLGDAEITVCLISDAEMARMNEAFRKKSGSTDVLSFPSVRRQRPISIKPGPRSQMRSTVLGEIAISPAMARRNARRYRRTLANEMRILILHGVLHLLGYDHETDRGRMNRLEQNLRRRLGLA